MLIKIEGSELGEGLIVVLVPVKKPAPKPGLRKRRTIETTGEALIDAVPLKAAGGQR